MDNICKKCGGVNTCWHEDHPDTGMNEMILVCQDCRPRVISLPLLFRVRESISIKWKQVWGRYVVKKLFRVARWSTTKTSGYCTWCGSQPGFNSSISRKGLRCTKCQEH